jgi:hypothetical protein
MDTTRHRLLHPLALASKAELLRYLQEPLVPTRFVCVARDAGAFHNKTTLLEIIYFQNFEM